MARANNLATTLERLVSLCQRNLFQGASNSNASDAVVNTLNFSGPGGTLLRNNIQKEWMDGTIKSSDEIIFSTSLFNSPAASMKDSKNESDHKSYLAEKLTFSKNCLTNYTSLLHFLNGRLPFGITECGLHNIFEKQRECPILTKISMPEGHYCPIRLNAERTHMLLQFFSPPKVASQWYSTWQHRRLSWWKHLSGTPSNFHSTSVQASNGYQLVAIQYKFPWGSRTIETICNYGSEPLQLLSEKLKQNCQVKVGKKTVYPYVIESVTSVEAAILTYLMDAMKEKLTKDGTSRLVLCLHNHLAPYKVSLASSGASSQIKDIIKFLAKELRNMGLAVLDLPDNSSMGLEHQFMRYDEIGIPYCIVLNEGTLKNGIIGLRNRDTTLQEQLHVSEVSKILYRYICSD